MRKDRWFRGALMKQRLNVFTAAVLGAAVLVGASFILTPQPAEAGMGQCADQFDALIDATIEVKFACRPDVASDDCREATIKWFDAMNGYIECTAEQI